MSGNLSQHRRGEEHVGTGPGRIGTGSRVVSVLSRIMQIISAAVVAGVLGHYLHNIHDGGAGSNGRIVYAVVIAGISLLVALLLIVPMKFSFFGFPLDFLIFVCWMVAFGLLVNVRYTPTLLPTAICSKKLTMRTALSRLQFSLVQI